MNRSFTHHLVLLLATSGGLAGCLEKKLSPSDFVCASAEACDASPPSGASDADAGEPRDSELSDAADGADAGFPDAADSGIVGEHASCPEFRVVASDGRASGNLATATLQLDSECRLGSGAFEVHRLLLPHALSWIYVSAEERDDIIISFRGEDCARGELECATRGVYQQRVPPGAYHIVVNGAANTGGTYALDVRGGIALDEPCDPRRPEFPCDWGSCVTGPSGFRCTILDCPDSPPIDADRDGQTDEDSCAASPIVACPADFTVTASRNETPIVGTVEPATGLSYRWRVESAPVREVLYYPVDNVSTYGLAPTMTGDYRLRYEARNGRYEVAACETLLRARSPTPLRVEIAWQGSYTDADLFLISPRAANWYQLGQSCHAGFESVDWGEPGPNNDPIFDGDRYDFRGSEAMGVATPELLGTYGFGLQITEANGHTNLWARVICGDREVYRRGPVAFSTLRRRSGVSAFWKIAEIAFDGTDCAVTPYEAAGQPLVVTEAAATAAR